MKRLMVLSILIIIILLSFNSIGCQQKTESDTAPSPTTTPTPVPTPTPTPTPTTTPQPTTTPSETDSICNDIITSWRLRGNVEILKDDKEIPVLNDAKSQPEPEWCFFSTPEALPTMRNYFKNQGLGNGWSEVEGKGFEEVEKSLSYWARGATPNGAMLWMVPDEPDTSGTYIALVIYERK